MNLVEPEGMKNASLSFLPIEPATTDQAVLAHALQQDRGGAREGIHKLTRATWCCLPAHQLAVYQSSQPPVKRLAAPFMMVQSHELEELRVGYELRAQDLTQEREVSGLVELN
jgi:hypothetical protein